MKSLRQLAERTLAPDAALRALEDFADQAGALPEEFMVHIGNLMVLSPPMLGTLRRYPEWLTWLHRRHDLPEEPADFMDRIRVRMRREYLDIAFCDIAGTASFEDTVRRLSDLADAVVSQALEYCWQELLRAERRIEPRPPEGFAVFALGKLGGRELNYSSDLDLLFCCRTCDDKEEQRFYTRLGELLVRILSQAGPDGFLYRIDLRLRPYGDTGPLVPTLDSLITYYESWGEAWERQALIKARQVAGDRGLGRNFGAFVGRYVFGRTMEDGSLEELKRVKHRAEKEYARPDQKIHIKQGPGGIRDIEFYVQYHQLIAGSKSEAARAPATLDALESLNREKVLLEGELSQLSLAYRLLRTVEHRLQLRALTPQPVIPDQPRELESLARGLGFGSAAQAPGDTFLSLLGAHRTRVRAIVERIYLTPGYLRLCEKEEELAQLLTERIPRDRARQLLGAYGFQDPDKAWRNIRLMALGPDGRMLPPAERRAFLGFVFPLLEVLRDTLDPDQALHRLESFASATGNRVSFLRALIARRPHLARLSNLLAFSNLSHHILVRHPEYFDTLARGIHLHEGRSMDAMHEELSSRFGASPRDDARTDVVRRFRQREMIRIAYRDLAGLADSLEISAELSDLAEACLRAAANFTRPAHDVLEAEEIPPLQIVAMGKLGSRQMHYSSDLDLVFLYPDPPAAFSTADRADLQMKLDGQVERLIEFLAGITREGLGYRIDLRLRPEGSFGLLARSWSGFVDYARARMQPWERMALVRSRVLFATPASQKRWHAALDEIVYGFPWDESACDEIRRLKRRIEAEKSRESRTHVDFKYGMGGVTDVEFLVQFLRIQSGARRRDCDGGMLSEDEGKRLNEVQRFQRHVENHYQLMEEWMLREISRESPALARLARSLGYAGDHARARFLSDWDERARYVRHLLDRIFYRGDARVRR